MLDPLARRLLDPWLDRIGQTAGRTFSANQVTLFGALVGLAALPAIAADELTLALLLIAANRLCDGLDGAIARHSGPTELGGYLDAICDFLFYAAVPVGFAFRETAHAPFAALLLFGFMATATTFLAYAAIAARRDIRSDARGRGKAFFYLGGLTEGTETIALFALCCLFPAAFPWLASGFAAMCFVTAATRAYTAWQTLTADAHGPEHDAQP
ncbi:MAG: CDP-alcohol phosphatidyltransferase family protein [Pseudomonadota bacterium]